MGLLCNCPPGASLGAIPISTCPSSLGQIQKVVFQRLYASAGVKNSIDPGSGAGGIEVLATWTALLAAADSTKTVVSPYIQAPTVEAGAAREFGGGNETLGGIPIIIGREPTTFTGNILQTSQDTIEALKAYQCEEVGVYLIDEFGRIGALVDDHAAPTEIFPIPIASLFVGDKVLGGLESVDMNAISWRFFPNWSDKLTIVTPDDFNALSDLVNP